LVETQDLTVAQKLRTLAVTIENAEELRLVVDNTKGSDADKEAWSKQAEICLVRNSSLADVHY
jgi:hypothetical protein